MKKIVYILFILSAAFTSCTQVINVDVPEEANKLVIDGTISTEMDSSYVRLTKSVSYFSSDPIPDVSNATVMVNGVSFVYVSNGVYKPASPYAGTVNTPYNLQVTYEGKTYTSSCLLDPMFEIDSIFPVFKEAQGPIEEGYTVTVLSIDNRPRIKYTRFKFGYKNHETGFKDSIYDAEILFDNKNTKMNELVPFEIPFLRLKTGDTALIIYRSCDLATSNFYMAVGNSGQGGPFSTPPANLPTNIKGGALGLFAAYDVKRFRVKIPG